MYILSVVNFECGKFRVYFLDENGGRSGESERFSMENRFGCRYKHRASFLMKKLID